MFIPYLIYSSFIVFAMCADVPKSRFIANNRSMQPIIISIIFLVFLVFAVISEIFDESVPSIIRGIAMPKA